MADHLHRCVILGIGPREGVFMEVWANLGRAIVTNGDFMAYVCDSAATRPSSQITLCRLVIIRPIIINKTRHVLRSVRRDLKTFYSHLTSAHSALEA